MDQGGWKGDGIVAAWLAAGHGLIFVSGIESPILLTSAGDLPVALVPQCVTDTEVESMVAWCTCELSRRTLGWAGFAERIANLSRIAA